MVVWRALAISRLVHRVHLEEGWGEVGKVDVQRYSSQGTWNNEGCNKHTGECTCKRFVTGENCDQCIVSTVLQSYCSPSLPA